MKKENVAAMNQGPEIIVATGMDGEIGIGGQMIWHVPGDLKRFKAITMGGTVVMGRKTWESLPVKPLPGRRNIVVSRSASNFDGAEAVASLREALDVAESGSRVFIIGGSEVYKQMLPESSVVHLTRIFSRCSDAEAYFPQLNPQEWTMTDASEIKSTAKGVRYRFETYKRRK